MRIKPNRIGRSCQDLSGGTALGPALVRSSINHGARSPPEGAADTGTRRSHIRIQMRRRAQSTEAAREGERLESGRGERGEQCAHGVTYY
jgi:hypothetical protein